jgi:integrase
LSKKKTDPYKRHRTRWPGITYGEKADGSRSYFVRHAGKQVLVEGGEKEARELQAKLRSEPKAPLILSNVRLERLAEEWLSSERHLRSRTLSCYRDALDRIVLPTFGSMKVSAIKAQHIAQAIRDLEGRDLSYSTINNYLLPLGSTLAFAASRGLIAQSPVSLLTKDERPRKKVTRSQDHVWSGEEIQALLEASEYVARQPESRYDDSPVLRIAVFTGLRPGESFGLQWRDIDFKRQELRVERQWTRQGEFGPPMTDAAYRRIPLSDDLVSFLREHHKTALASSLASEMVFPSRNEGRSRIGTSNGAASTALPSLRGSRASRSTRSGTPSPAA